MNPDDEREFEKIITNRQYAPDEQWGYEAKIIAEKTKDASSDFERAKLAREALLEVYKEKGMLSSEGEKSLVALTPKEVRDDDEVYFKDPALDENNKVTMHRR